MAHRSPKELIDIYWFEVWNQGKAELIREICGDPMTRYVTTGPVEMLSHDQQVERIAKNVATLRPRFTHEVLIADDVHVCSVWNMFSDSDRLPRMSGIEVFRAEGGRLVECWNPPYGYQLWDGEA